MRFILKLLRDERGDSEMIETAVAFILIMGIFIAFTIYTNSARAKVVMNYSAKEGARAFAISKSASEGKNKANDYLSIGGINGASVSASGSTVKIEKNIPIYVPFFLNTSLKLKSEVDFYEELDPNYYLRGASGQGWLSTPSVTTRPYDDDSWNR